MKMKKSLCFIMAMIIAITEMTPINTKAAETENEVLPFSLEATDKHVEDAEIIAKELVLTSDNASIVDTGLTDFVVVKEIVHSVQAKVYLVSSKGVLHTFLVDADDPWLDKLEAKEDAGFVHTSNRAIEHLEVCYSRPHKDAFDDYQSNCYYEDALFVILNPQGKYDLLNLSSGKYFSYNCDGFDSRIFNNSNNFIFYKQDGKYGLLNGKGEKLCEAKFDTANSSFISESVYIASYYDAEAEETRLTLVSNDGTFNGTESYKACYGVNPRWNNPYDYSHYSYSNGLTWEENTGVVVKDCNGEFLYIDLVSGEKTSLNGDHIAVTGRMENNVIAYTNGVEDKASGEVGFKSYLISGQKHMDLNDSLGGDYCSIESIRSNDESVREYMWACSYSYVRDSDGVWTRDYYYQGVIDSDGKKVYGSTLPEYWHTDVLDFKGEYGLRRWWNSAGEVGYWVVQRGKQTPIYNFDSDYEINLGTYISSVTDDYILLSTGDIIDAKKGKLIEGLGSVILDSKLNVNGEQYAVYHFYPNVNTYREECVTLHNLSTDEKFELKLDNSLNFRTMVKEADEEEDNEDEEKNERALFWIGDVFAEADTILNEKLQPVEHGKGRVIYISEDLNIVTSEGIYNYDGKCILKTYLKHTEVERDEKGNGLLPACNMKDNNGTAFNSDAQYTFCDIKGNLLNDYKYNTISRFRKGIACVTYEEDYDDEVALIDNSGKTLVKFSEDDIRLSVCEYLSLSHICDKLEVNGKEFVIYYSDSAYIYDLSAVAKRMGDLEEASYNQKEEQDYNELLAQAEEMNDIKLSGMKSTFRVPDEVPVIGGEDFDFDFSIIPIVAEKSGNTFRMGIGIEMKEGKLFSLNKRAWKNFKKNIESMDDDIIKGELMYKLSQKYGTVSTGLKKKVKSSVYGYAEGTISKGRVQSIQGMIVIKISFSAKKQWQKVVAHVPLVLTLEGGASIETNVTPIGYDYSQKAVYLDGTVELELPEMKVAGGVGVICVGDASAYGSVKNVLSIDKYHIQDYVKGDLGVSLNFLCFSKEESLWPYGRKVIYDSTGGIVTSSMKKMSLLGTEDDYVIERTDQNLASDWKADVKETGTANQMTVLQENAYTKSNPQIVALDDGTIMMIHTADLSERETGNHTAVVYSLYDKEKGMWSNPQKVEDNGTADYYPTLATDGKTAYVAWVDSNSDQFSADASMEEIASSCEIKVARFDAESKSFVERQKLSDNNCADIMPSLVVHEGEAHIVWTSNSANDMLTLSGDNTVYYGHCKDGKWVVEELLSKSQPIGKVKIGNLNDVIQVAYLTDSDGNMETTDDMVVNVCEVSSPERIYTHTGNGITDIQFASLGREDALFVTEEKGLEYTKDSNAYSVLLDAEGGGYTQYDIIPKGNSTLILGCKASSDNSNIVGHIYEDGVLSSAIPITQQNNYINCVDGVSVADNTYLIFKRDKAKFTENSFEVTSDICSMTFSDYIDLELEEVIEGEDDIIPGKETSLDVVIENVGMQDVASYTVEIKDDDEVIGTYNVNEILKKGEIKELTISCIAPETLDTDSQLTVSIICDGDVNPDNDSKSVVAGYPDLELTVHQFDSEQQNSAILYVEDVSSYDAENVQIIVRKQNSTGNIVKTFDVGHVKNGNRKKVCLTSEDIQAMMDNAGSLYVEVTSESKEEYYTNNYGFIYSDETENREIYLENSELYFDRIGQQKKIEYTVLPAGTESKVIFYSSDKDVVDVSEDGIVKAIGDGNATVYLALKDNEEVTAGVSCEVNTESGSNGVTAPSVGNVGNPIIANNTTTNTKANTKTNTSAKKSVKKKISKPKKVKLKYVSALGKGKVAVIWKLFTSQNGFQLQYAQNRKFTKKSKMVRKNRYTSIVTLKKLKRGKTYYFRVRAYNKSGSKKKYGKWSNVKKIKIK